VACLGPVTRTGCGALCPSFGRGCYGCFGPKEVANTPALAEWFASLGYDDDQIVRLYAQFNVGAPAFHKIVAAKR